MTIARGEVSRAISRAMCFSNDHAWPHACENFHVAGRERMPAPHECLPPPRRQPWCRPALVLAMLLALAQGSWEARRGAAGSAGKAGDGDGRAEDGPRSAAKEERENMLQRLFEFTERPRETGSPLRSVGRCLLCMRTVIVDRVQKGSRLSPGRALKWTACIKVRGHGIVIGTVLLARRARAHAR